MIFALLYLRLWPPFAACRVPNWTSKASSIFRTSFVFTGLSILRKRCRIYFHWIKSITYIFFFLWNNVQGGRLQNVLIYCSLLLPQVFGAIRQAVQRAPHYPECHNLNGLSCESRFDYQSAVASYRLARYAVANSSSNASKSHIRDISINLARSLSRVCVYIIICILKSILHGIMF